MKKLAILGSTGSIGTQTLDIVAHNPELYRVEGLAAGTNLPVLLEQIRRFQPRVVSVQTKELADKVKEETGSSLRVLWGEEGLLEVAVATDAETVVTAVVGSLGLRPTLAAIEAGKEIALANKETLVCAGAVVTEAARRKGVRLLPVDSEHSAIFQCLNGESREDVNKLIITASGGSFRDRTRDELRGVTVEQALRHPNWSMGAKITIDSATMSNKGLEVMEARWLFDLPYDRIEVLLHPESVVHSMVEFADYSIIAQLGNPDMRVPIQYALTWPSRRPTPTSPLNLAQIGSLHFREMDFDRYPNLRMAYESGRAGGTAPAVFNAANEAAVSRFLGGEISFLGIEEVIARTLDALPSSGETGLEAVLEADSRARETAAAVAVKAW